MKITKTLDISADSDGWIVASTPTPDRDRDRVMPLGAQLANFERNPVVMFGHNYWEPWALIGRAAEMSVDASGLRFRPELREPANESDPMHVIRALWEQRLLRAASIGFSPLESRENEFGGRDFIKWELLEISLVPVPANQEAIRLAVKALSAKNESHTEADTAHSEAPAPNDELTQLTPGQEAQLVEALAQLTEEMTSLFTGG